MSPRVMRSFSFFYTLGYRLKVLVSTVVGGEHVVLSNLVASGGRDLACTRPCLAPEVVPYAQGFASLHCSLWLIGASRWFWICRHPSFSYLCRAYVELASQGSSNHECPLGTVRKAETLPNRNLTFSF